jgi:hypothetical protein
MRQTLGSQADEPTSQFEDRERDNTEPTIKATRCARAATLVSRSLIVDRVVTASTSRSD